MDSYTVHTFSSSIWNCAISILSSIFTDIMNRRSPSPLSVALDKSGPSCKTLPQDCRSFMRITSFTGILNPPIVHPLTLFSPSTKTSVLYSCDQGVWKIADFGFSREWTSKTTLTTSAARGTETYRAPELVKREEATFSDRSDVWAAGCILYELASRTKAFRSDWNVGEYARSQIKLLIPLQRFVEADTRVPLKNLVHEMLQIDPKRRPSAKDLCALFKVLMKRTWYTFLVETDIPLLSRISQSQEEEQSAIRT